MISADFARPRSDSGARSSLSFDAPDHSSAGAQLNEPDQESPLAGAGVDDDDNPVEGASLLSLPRTFAACSVCVSYPKRLNE